MRIVSEEILEKNLDKIFKTAREYHIKEIKIFGNHIGQDFPLQAGVNFIVVSDGMMAGFHKREFDSEITWILKGTVASYTEEDFEQLIRDDIISEEQASTYLKDCQTLSQFLNGKIEDNENKETISLSFF